ncbi:MAG: sortase [Acidimicrobiia bacterium]|nr:sortase [Acidimicrobiia bacterium]
MRKVVRGLGWLLVVFAVVVAQFIVYELWYSDVLTARAQEAAAVELDEILATSATQPSIVVAETSTSPQSTSASTTTIPPTTTAPPPPTTTPPTTPPPTTKPEKEIRLYPEEWADDVGGPIGRISIPSVDLDVVLFAGVDTETLKKGPGAMPSTSFPGQPGNATISGHRTTYGRPFHDLEELEPGDEILVETAVGTHTYAVRRLFIVPPTGVWVTDEMAGGWLTLTACHPKYSAAQRLIVQAEMVKGPNAPLARHLSEIEPPIPRDEEDKPIEIIFGEF